MKKSTIILVALFAAGLAYYFLVERKAKPPEEAAREAKRLLHVKEAEIRSIRIAQTAGSVDLVRAENDAWRMTAPVRARADRWACSAAAGALADLQQVRSFKNEKGQKGLEEMGLARPRVRVEFTLGQALATRPAPGAGMGPAPPPATGSAGPPPEGAPSAAGRSDSAHSSMTGAGAAPPTHTSPPEAGEASRTVLEIGGEVPASDSTFLRIAGKDDIYLVPSSAAGAFLKPIQDYRDHTLLDMTILDIGEARIARADGELRFRRRSDDWWVEQPIEDLAEGSAVQTLLSSLIGLRADSFLDDAAGTGLETATDTVMFFSPKGEQIASLVLGAGPAGQEGKRYAKAEVPGEPATIAIVPAGESVKLSQPASAFRAKKILPFHTWDATGIDLTSPAGTLSFHKKEGIWTATTPASLKVDGGAVEETLRDIADLDVSTYDAGKGSGPASLGLEPARARIAIAFEGDSKPRSLVIGSTVAGAPGTVYAKSSDRPGVFTVPSSVLERLSGGASLYAEKPPATEKPDAGAKPSGVPPPPARGAGSSNR